MSNAQLGTYGGEPAFPTWECRRKASTNLQREQHLQVRKAGSPRFCYLQRFEYVLKRVVMGRSRSVSGPKF